MKIEEAIKLLNDYPLSAGEMESVMEEIMTGKIEKPLIISFLTALNKQGITSEELVGAARVMRRYMTKITTNHKVVLDTCGTGGDRKHTFNISTAAALVASGAAIAVAKHGNRSVSSKCGSADVLEALGVNINMSKETAESCLDETGITFLFAPNFHPAMRYVMEARKEIAQRTGEKTIFNLLGPLCNPVEAKHQLIGAPDRGSAESIASALTKLDTVHALVVYGEDVMDEMTTRVSAKTRIYEIRNGKLENSDGVSIDAEDFKFNKTQPGDLRGGTPQENAKIFQDILENKEKGPYRDIVILNAAAAIYAADKAESIEGGIKLARESIDSGNALKKLELLKKCSNKGE